MVIFANSGKMEAGLNDRWCRMSRITAEVATVLNRDAGQELELVLPAKLRIQHSNQWLPSIHVSLRINIHNTKHTYC